MSAAESGAVNKLDEVIGVMLLDQVANAYEIECLESVKVSIAALLAERRWRGIESAPMDGTPVLILILAYGTGPERIMRVAEFWDGMWRNDEEDDDGYFPPIAWMPLPAPPAIAQGGDNEQ